MTARTPNQAMPLVERDGFITQPWFTFLQALATGGASVVAGVSSFMGRTGPVALLAADIVAALGFTPGTGTVSSSGPVTAGQTAVFIDANTIKGVSVGSVSVVAAVTLLTGQIVAFTAGGAILADATDATKPATGWAMANAAAGSFVTIGLPGSVNVGLTGLTAGAAYFLSTAGAVTATVPTTGANQFVGYATPAGNLLFDPGADQLL